MKLPQAQRGEFVNVQQNMLDKACSSAGLKSYPILLWIAIQSHDKPFAEHTYDAEDSHPVGDIIITNEHARDK